MRLGDLTLNAASENFIACPNLIFSPEHHKSAPRGVRRQNHVFKTHFCLPEQISLDFLVEHIFNGPVKCPLVSCTCKKCLLSVRSRLSISQVSAKLSTKLPPTCIAWYFAGKLNVLLAKGAKQVFFFHNNQQMQTNRVHEQRRQTPQRPVIEGKSKQK